MQLQQVDEDVVALLLVELFEGVVPQDLVDEGVEVGVQFGVYVLAQVFQFGHHVVLQQVADAVGAEGHVHQEGGEELGVRDETLGVFETELVEYLGLLEDDGVGGLILREDHEGEYVES